MFVRATKPAPIYWGARVLARLQILGAVTVRIYPTLTAQQAAFIIQDSGARVVIASSAD